MIIQIIALFCCGTFFGAAVYISLVQHPAALEYGVSVGGQFFPPMYKRAAPMQIFLALTGFITGILAWYFSGDYLWFIGGLFLISVVPILKSIGEITTGTLVTRGWNPELSKTIICQQ